MSRRLDYWEDLVPEKIYHIYNRAVGKENLFRKPDNYRYFLDKWKQHLPYLEVYAYRLMPNHFHFLARVKPLDDDLITHLKKQTTVKSQLLLHGELSYSKYLEDQFKRLFSGYALAFNRQEDRPGALFQKRFKRISVKSEMKLLYLLAYIHHNALHHGFCTAYEDWPYSSWSAYQRLEKRSLLNREEVLSWFHADPVRARALFLEYHREFRLDREMEDYVYETFEVS